MILCDTSVIVSAINRADKDHARCVAVLRPLEQRLITTRACIAEAMHLIGSYNGWSGQLVLIEWIETDFLMIHAASSLEDKRICALMRQYRDAPMDYADASLVAAAETLRLNRVLTLDRHFYAYRINGRKHFVVMPD
jgi:predicted nucleic acid-binding protein